MRSTHPDAIRSRARRALANHPTAQGSLRASPEAVQQQHRADTERIRAGQRTRNMEQRRNTASEDVNGESLQFLSTYHPCPIKNPWHTSPCKYCGATLLTAETPKWCCNNGKNVLEPLPPLTPQLQTLLSLPHDAQRVCQSSQTLNNLFCLSALGVSEKWTEYRGVQCFESAHNFARSILRFLGGAFWLAM